MTLTLELIRHEAADAPGENPTDIPLDENLLDHGPDPVRVMSLRGRRRRDHGVVADFADLAGEPAVDVRVPLLEAS